METPRNPRAMEIAEKILQVIYGDDLLGCTVTLEEVAAIVEAGIKAEAHPTREVLDAFKKVVDAIHRLSTPPSREEVKDSNDLQQVLGNRLDGINEICTKTITAIATLSSSSADENPTA